MTLIGISGKAQHGKDTVADILLDLFKPKEHLYPPLSLAFKIKFADELYKEVASFLRVSHPSFRLLSAGQAIDLIHSEKANYRLLLQWWGTNYRRRLNDNYWADKWLRAIHRLPVTTSLIVCSDVRFLNEANLIKELGGIFIRVNRNYYPIEDKHESECQLDNYKGFDFVIDNESLEDLNMQVTNIYKQLTRQK